MNCSASIVYSNSWTAQTSALSLTDIITVGPGIFRISLALDGTASGSGYVVLTAEVQWAIGSGTGQVQINNLQISPTLDAEGGNVAVAASTVNLLTSSQLNLTTTVTDYDGGTLSGYDVYVIVEQLF